MYYGQASIKLRTKPVISRDRIRWVDHKGSMHGHQTSFITLGGGAQLHILSPSRYSDSCLESGSPQEQSPWGGWHDLLKTCSWDKLARERGNLPGEGRGTMQGYFPSEMLHEVVSLSPLEIWGLHVARQGLSQLKARKQGFHTLQGENGLPGTSGLQQPKGSLLNKVLTSGPHKWSFQSPGDGSSEMAKRNSRCGFSASPG